MAGKHNLNAVSIIVKSKKKNISCYSFATEENQHWGEQWRQCDVEGCRKDTVNTHVSNNVRANQLLTNNVSGDT